MSGGVSGQTEGFDWRRMIERISGSTGYHNQRQQKEKRMFYFFHVFYLMTFQSP
jgi:hypothetical protein